MNKMLEVAIEYLKRAVNDIHADNNEYHYSDEIAKKSNQTDIEILQRSIEILKELYS